MQDLYFVGSCFLLSFVHWITFRRHVQASKHDLKKSLLIVGFNMFLTFHFFHGCVFWMRMANCDRRWRHFTCEAACHVSFRWAQKQTYPVCCWQNQQRFREASCFSWIASWGTPSVAMYVDTGFYRRDGERTIHQLIAHRNRVGITPMTHEYELHTTICFVPKFGVAAKDQWCVISLGKWC